MKDVAKVDLDLDGKKEEIQLRIWPSFVVDAYALHAETLVDAEILVKDDGKIIKVGQVERVRYLSPISVLTTIDDKTKEVQKTILILKIDEAYYAIVFPYKMILVPKELIP